ncbi:exodeoxyribonuclease I [Gallaecimonas sp. GXIMD4217]|uniref:exodeoxyribonuclease I n=1 Tax=Gallaecimonas sp. GXIMD4217 TaxID=3131927 RepID=UPI00311B04BF
MSNDATLLWHDYETFGADPKKDRPAQFAAIRTDLDLNEVGEPLEWYCQPPNDYLPRPGACLVTGITPQIAQARGLGEPEFMARIHAEMSKPNTCVVGYNSIRFDDEVSRFGFYRNFFDPYSREWQHGNSRWDLLDVVRATYALRPEGINWPEHEDGKPSFKLEHLTQANGISHADAHDAVSDVRATIALARLIKEKQPRLFDFFFKLRRKQAVAELIDVINLKPLVHSSGKIPALQGCTTYVAPLVWHPVNKNAVIVVDLNGDLGPLLKLDDAALKARLYTPQAELAEGESRPPVKLVHINKCPILAPAKTLTPERADELGIDRQRCRENLETLKAHPELRDKLVTLFSEDGERPAQDADEALYGGFFSDQDRATMEVVRRMDPQQLASGDVKFQDPRLNTLLFRYRARNYPHTLSEAEAQKWQRHREEVLVHGGSGYGMEDLMLELETLAQEKQDDSRAMNILKAVYDYAQSL